MGLSHDFYNGWLEVTGQSKPDPVSASPAFDANVAATGGYVPGPSTLTPANVFDGWAQVTYEGGVAAGDAVASTVKAGIDAGTGVLNAASAPLAAAINTAGWISVAGLIVGGFVVYKLIASGAGNRYVAGVKRRGKKARREIETKAPAIAAGGL